jgi:hypothetical protein
MSGVASRCRVELVNGVAMRGRAAAGRGMVVVFVVALLLAFLAVVETRGLSPAGADGSAKCNGHVELCSRAYNEVAYAATHNSMNAVADGFVSPDQERSIPDQLAGGIRAFLIDVYRGTPGTGRVCTDPTPLLIAQLLRDKGQAAVDQLLQLRSTEPCPAPGGPTSGVYLCHSFCELGATNFADQLTSLRAFLGENPNDVVTLILEDYAPAEDIMSSFRAANLDGQMLWHQPGDLWPTLAEMKARGTRLVVFSQNQGGAAQGLLDAFQEMNETPYTFQSAAEFSCDLYRGPAQASLFLLNHWIDTGDKRAAAQVVNQYTVLYARAQQCATERGHIPNFVAVNFAEVGDLLPVVDDLNGFQPAISPQLPTSGVPLAISFQPRFTG